jgi:hypothetical protein
MKKSFYIIDFLLILGYFQSYSQSLGFEQSECGIITNSSYSFENYIVPNHGCGYWLYHNGDIIAGQGQNSHYGGWQGMELRFIDDSSGYFIVQVVPFSDYDFQFEIYRIIYDTVILLGTVPGYDYDFFIVNRHTLYFSSTTYVDLPYYAPILFICRLSDILSQKYIVYSDSLVSDTTVIDTIAGVPICPGLNEINYFYQIPNDTLIYRIQFSVDTIVNIGNKKISRINLYPNPAQEYLNVETSQKENPFTIQILDYTGVIRKSIFIPRTGKTEVYIGDLKNGFFFIVLDNSQTQEVHKLIKI